MTREPFGVTREGAPVERFTLAGPHGIRVSFIGYGGIITSILVPDRHGAPGEITLGYDTPDGWLADRFYLGALIGRVANRIAGARFTLDGRVHELERNEGANHLHGGSRGFHTVPWRVEPWSEPARCGALLSHTSPAGEAGYPGALSVRVSYSIEPDGCFIMDLRATTDAATPVSLTQHTYFNLAGRGRDILGHELQLHASRFTPVDAALLPTGEIRDAGGTPFDFRTPRPLGRALAEGAGSEQLRRAGGFDHNFVLDHARGAEPVLAARLTDPASGRVLEILTTEPGLQLYTGNALHPVPAPGGALLTPHAGVALETQHFPDSPNHPDFPSIILRPGQEYRSRTIWRFATVAREHPSAY